MMWNSEIRINLKIDADAGVVFVSGVKYIYQGQWSEYTGKCACVYGVYSVNNKIEIEINLTDCTSNLT
jgi:hypothetical protein